MEKRIVFAVVTGLALLVLAFLLVGKVFACVGDECKSDGNVMYSGEGNQGDIFVYNCEKNDKSNTDIGSWVDPTTIPSLKGEKGDTGLQGIAGKDGLNGLNGKDGINGINGLDGLKGDPGIQGLQGFNGVDGTNGLDGLKGDKGDTGEAGKDVDPKIVTDLQNTDTILQDNINIEQFDRIQLGNNLQNNINSTNNRIDDVSNRVSKLENTQYNIRTEVKFVREKNLEVGIYSKYNTNRNVCAEVGLNIVVPIGESYQDRENKKINTRLDRLEHTTGINAIIEKTLDSKGHLKSITISQGQLEVNGKF